MSATQALYRWKKVREGVGRSTRLKKVVITHTLDVRPLRLPCVFLWSGFRKAVFRGPVTVFRFFPLVGTDARRSFPRLLNACSPGVNFHVIRNPHLIGEWGSIGMVILFHAF